MSLARAFEWLVFACFLVAVANVVVVVARAEFHLALRIFAAFGWSALAVSYFRQWRAARALRADIDRLGK